MYNVCEPYVVTLLDRTPGCPYLSCEWDLSCTRSPTWQARSENGHKNNICYDVVNTILGSTINTSRKSLYDHHLKEKEKSHFDLL